MIGNRRIFSLWVLGLPLVLALISLGCSLGSRIVSAETDHTSLPTRTPMPTFTPTADGAAFVDVPTVAAQPSTPTAVEQATQPESPEPSPTSTTVVVEPTATPTPEGVSVTILQNMNVRSGPGTNYPVIGPAPVGASAKVLGRNDDGSWLQIEYPSDSGLGWIYAKLVQVNGAPDAVAIAQAPPPPPPPPTATPVPPPPEPEKPKYQFTPTGWHASGNAGIIQFKGRMRDEGGNLVNGYSVLVDNWSWSVVSHPGGASVHYPEKGDGEWDVVIAKESMGGGVGWWYLTVVRYDCPDFFARFDAQCKQFTRLSEDVKIMVNWPDETIINADWVCHWDCDKGLYTQAYRRP